MPRLLKVMFAVTDKKNKAEAPNAMAMAMATSETHSASLRPPPPQKFNHLVLETCKEESDTGYTARDVLCEKGGRANQHSGNRVFLRLVQRNKAHYRKLAHDKIAKDWVIQSILTAIQQNGGRFLKRCSQTNGWVAVSYERAYTKVRQALREPDRTVHKAAVLANEMAASHHRGKPKQKTSLDGYHSSDDSIEGTRPVPCRSRSTLWDSARPPVPHRTMHNAGAAFQNKEAQGQSTVPASCHLLADDDANAVPPPLQTLLARDDSLFLPQSLDVVWTKASREQNTIFDKKDPSSPSAFSPW